MAKPIPKIGDFNGTIDGITYYTLNGKRVCRKAAPPSREKIHKDPRFAKVRANNKEFGGAATLAKAIAAGLQENVALFKDPYFSGRLTGACRKIIQKGSGAPGQRTAHLLNHPEALIGIQLNSQNSIDQKVMVKPRITRNASGNIRLQILDLKAYHFKNPPKSATHLQLTAALSSVSIHRWDPETNRYTPVNQVTKKVPANNQNKLVSCSAPDNNLEWVFPIPAQNAETTAHTIWLGIRFGQMENSQFIPSNTSKAMECIAVL